MVGVRQIDIEINLKVLMVLTSKKLIVVFQGYILWPLLFIIYINDLCHAIKYSTVHRFADERGLIDFNAVFPLICPALFVYPQWN